MWQWHRKPTVDRLPRVSETHSDHGSLHIKRTRADVEPIGSGILGPRSKALDQWVTFKARLNPAIEKSQFGVPLVFPCRLSFQVQERESQSSFVVSLPSLRSVASPRRCSVSLMSFIDTVRLFCRFFRLVSGRSCASLECFLGSFSSSFCCASGFRSTSSFVVPSDASSRSWGYPEWVSGLGIDFGRQIDNLMVPWLSRSFPNCPNCWV